MTFPEIPSLHLHQPSHPPYMRSNKVLVNISVGSWTYDGFQVDLTNKSAEVDLHQYTVNGGWDLISTNTTRNVVYYPCCPEPFPDVTFTIVLRRRTLYYVMNVITPCLLLSGLSLLGESLVMLWWYNMSDTHCQKNH